METKPEKIKPELPKLNDLLGGDLAYKGIQNDLNILLNAEPPKGWLRVHPLNSNIRYIPIERIEWLLTRLFFSWRVEIKTAQIIANSMVVTVRLFYLDRLSEEYLWQDGIGAAPLQTDKGAGAIEFNKIKDNAVMLAAPSAESYAIKDAAEKIGKIFGKDLNRKDEILYYDLVSAIPKQDRYSELLDEETNTK